MRKLLKSVIAFIISMTMAFEAMPLYVFAEIANDLKPIILNCSVPKEDAENSISISTLSSAVDEGKSYILTIVRNNNKGKASATIKTVDLSAKYGEDYVIQDENCIVDEKNSKTLLEMTADKEQQQSRLDASINQFKDFISSKAAIDADDYEISNDELFEENSETISISKENEDEKIEPEASKEQNNNNESYYTTEESTSENEKEEEGNTQKSNLALLKEAQTGRATRKVGNTEFTPIENILIQETKNSFGDLIESSSLTTITFEDGEDTKQIEIKILDDDISEGTEAFDFIISDVSEGWNIGSNVNCTFTINDDEQIEHSLISFSENEYNSESGTVEIVIKREGAEYSLVTAMVRTISDGNAKEGENYARVSKLVEFAPYVNEQKINIPVRADEKMNFSLELYDIKGGNVGTNQKCDINIIPSENYTHDNDDILLTSNNDGKSVFKIKLDNTEYNVYYNSSDNYGDIVNDNFNPPVTVGKYFFPYPKEKNNGTFIYNCFFGDTKSTDRDSMYIKKGEKDCQNETGAGYLYWYNWLTTRKGGSELKAADNKFINTTPYQYVSADWYQDATHGGGQYVEMYLNKNQNQFKTKARGATGKFNRTMSDSIPFLNDKNLPVTTDINIGVKVQDRESNKTPKLKLYVYGIAAMYRKYKIDLEQPAPLTYIDGDKTVTRQPAVVEAAEGHSIRYFGQDYQINVRGTDDNEIYGKIKEYEITIGENPKNKSVFKYTPPNNKTSISINEDFIKLVDKNSKEITTEGSGFYTKLSIKPIFEYIDSKVNVLTSDKGHFVSSNLSTGQHTFHVGDRINLDGVSTKDGYEYIGYNMEVYKNSSDSQPIILNDVYKTSDSSSDLNLIITNQRYNLKPNFSEGNYIGIKLTENAKKYLSVINTVDKNNVSSNIMHNMEARNIEYALITDNTKSGDDSIKPVSGKVYTIQAKSNNSDYRAVFKLDSDNKFKVVGNCFDYTANSLSNKNIIIIDVEKINKNNEKIFAVSGYTMVPDASIRSTSQTSADQPASSLQLTAGGEFVKLNSTSNNYFLNRKSTASDEKGYFNIKGIKGYDGDCISVIISNGDIEKAEYITLNSNGIPKTSIQYNEIIDNNGVMTETPVVKDGYEINIGSIYMPIRSALAPYVSNITYTVEQLPDYTYDTRNNEIAILATYIEVTADVVRNGREVRSAIFKTVHKNGSYEEKRINSTNIGQSKFTARYKLDTEFESGDMLYVSLVDNEDRIFTTTYIDEETGKEMTETTKDEKIYYSVYTGLSFYIPTLDVEPQTFDFENKTTVNVPILGDIASSQKTGSISFDKTYYGQEGTPNRPYTLSFYFSPGYSTMASQTAQTTLANIKRGQSSAAMALKTSPTDEEKATLDELNKTFGGEDDASKAKFEKKFGKLAFSKSLSNITKQTPFDVHAMLLLSFDFFYDHNNNEYVLTSGQYCLGAMFSVAKCMYTTIYGVPVYLKLSGYLGANYSGMYTTDESKVLSQYDFTKTSNIANITAQKEAGYITTTFGGSASVGVGLCGVLGARGIINTAITAKFNLGKSAMTMTDDSVEGFLFKLGGGLGIDLFLFTIEYVPSILTYGTGCYKKVAQGSGSIIILSDNENSGNIRGINAGTSNLKDFGNNNIVQGNKENPYSYNIILNNARERTNPKITTFANGRKLLVFLANDGSNAPNNSSLMYSISDSNGKWSTPQKIDENGTADVLPKVITFDNDKKAAVIWSDANKIFDSETAPKDVLSSLELAYRVFDSETGNFGEKALITNDLFMDTGASFFYDEKENKLCCYYVKRDIKEAQNNQDIVDVAATYSTIAHKKYDINSTSWETEDILMDIPHDRINDPLIIDFNAMKGEFDGKNYVWMTYTVDEDENLMTSEDREVYVILEDMENSKTYYPIRLTNNYVSDIKPQLTKFNNDVYLSWIEDGKILKMTNLTGILTQMKEEGHIDKYLENTEKDWYKKTASELGMSSEEYSDSIYEKLYQNNISTTDKDFSTEENIDRTINEYQLYNENDKNLYAFWTESGYTKAADENAKPESSELYGSIFEIPSSENGYSSWSNPVKITDFGKYIDEFNITFDNNGDISMVSNMFMQNIDDKGNLSYSPNSLIEVDFSKQCLLSIDEIEFDEIPQPGKEININFDVYNNGLLSSEGYDINVFSIENGKSQNIYSQSSDGQLLPGYTDSYNILWEIPKDNFPTEIEIEISDKKSGRKTTKKKAIEKKFNIEITDEKAEFDQNGKLYYNAVITNSGNIPTGDITLTSYKNVKDDNKTEYGKHIVGNIEAGESINLSYELTNFKSASELTKYGYADIVNTYTIDGNEIKSTVVRAVALDVVDIIVNDNISEINLTKDNTATISTVVIPENVSSNEIAYSSNNMDIVKITSDGKIIPIKNGKTQITLLHTKSGFSKTINVNVSEANKDDETESTTEEVKNTIRGNGSSAKRVLKEVSKSIANKSEETAKKDDISENEKTKDFPFSDVSKNAWYRQCIEYVYENNLFKGISNTLFGPDLKATRGMIVTVLGRMEGINTSDYNNVSYTDVNKDMYYSPYIEWATQNNIVAGFGNNIFMPDENITREQLTQIIKNYLYYIGEDISTEKTTLPFYDVSMISNWAIEGVNYCYENGIITGDDKNMFNPKDNASRAEFASIIMNIMNK